MQQWFQKLRNRNENIENDEDCRCPLIIDNEELKSFIEEDPGENSSAIALFWFLIIIRHLAETETVQNPV